MAQTGYTPIQLYYSATASSVPLAANLASGELAINTNDGKLYYKDSAGVVQTIASKAGNVNVSSFSAGTTGFTPSTATTGAVTLAGTLATTNGGTGLTSFTANGVVYASSTSALATGSALTFDGSNILTFDGGSSSYFVGPTGEMLIGEDGSGLYVGGGAGGLPAIPIIYGSNATTFQRWIAGGSEQMRLTSTGLGIGTSTFASGSRLAVQTTSGKLDVRAYGGASAQISSSAALGYNSATGNGHIWQINDSEIARFDSSGNMGIGTSSPSYKLDVSSSAVSGVVANFQATAANTYGTIQLTGNSRGGELDFYNGSTAQAAIVGGTGNLFFYTNGNSSLKATLDSAGNLGLGVTPSDWSSASRPALQLPNGAALFTRSGSTFLGQNFFYNSSDTGTYIANGFATLYNQANGQHQWFNAPSGTANNTAALTQAMTLDASGRLGIGNTSPSKLLTVGSTTTANPTVRILGSLTAGSDTYQYSFGLDDTTDFAGLKFNYADRVAKGLQIFTASGYGYPISFSASSASQQMTLDTSGNLLVGTTSSSAKFSLQYNGATIIGQDINDADDQSNSTFMQFRVQGTQAGTIKRVASTSAVVYNTTSDYRLKTVTGSVTGYGARIDALKPVDYQWTDGGQNARGFLAHEFQTVYPNSVSGDKDAVDADGKPVYQSMQASTSEVIADLVAEIQSLRKRLADAGI